MTADELVRKLGTEKKTYKSAKGSMEYCRKLVGKPGKNGKYPVVLLLHGAGERGNGSNNGIQLMHGATDILAYAEKNMEGLLFLAPQCPQDKMWIKASWALKKHTMEKDPENTLALALEILDNEIKENNGDPDRVYITGLSMGGFGSWDALSRYPDRFAAALICCGGGDVKQAKKLVRIPIYVFHGEKDSVVMTSRSRDMVKAIRDAGGHKVFYKEYKNVDHGSWFRAYGSHSHLKQLFSRVRRTAKKK